MAYLKKRKRGNKVYYYLAEAVELYRGKRKWMEEYIGTEKPSEQKLRILLAEFEKKVEKERVRLHGHHYLTADEIKEIDGITKEFWQRYKNAGNVVQEQFDQNFVMVFVYNTNSIEGSTLSPKEVELLLSEDIAPNKPLDDVLEAKAAQKTLAFVKQTKKELSEQLLCKIHEIYFKDTKPSIAGQYKRYANIVRGSKFKPTLPELVPTDMRLFFQEYKKLKAKLHALELAAWAHWKIVRIHPFQDGNGRTARMVMNFILHKNNYPMIDIKTKEKKAYFSTLEKCNYNDNASALAVRLVRRFKKQYRNALTEQM